MISKLSRYRKLQKIVTTDAEGKMLTSQELRLLPEVTGKFIHTIEEMDRLDNLSYKYYSQSKKWWHICDINPETFSPQALLGKEPVVVDRFTLTFSDNAVSPPWATLQKNLKERSGVEDVRLEEDILLTRGTEMYEGQSVIVNAEQYERAVIITYNRMNVAIADLVNIITVSGFEAGQRINIGQIGKNLIIPPDIIS